MPYTDPDTEAAISISKSFSFEVQFTRTEELHKNLSLAICKLLLHDYQKLIFLLYRIDVNEEKFQAAFRSGSSESVSDKVATLVIERELEKARFRKKYRE